MSLLVVNPGAGPAAHPARRAGQLISLSVLARPGETGGELCRRLAARMSDRAAAPVHLQVFGACSAAAHTIATLQKILGRADWPVTWVEGSACGGQAIAGLQMHAFTGPVEPIRFRGRVVGSRFTDGGARHCVIGGLAPADKTLTRADQTTWVLEELQAILAGAGLALTDTVRTWFFLEDILAWYDDFNRARTRIYSQLRFRTGSLPASTGVGAKNPAGAALALVAWAFRPVETNSYAEEVASPLQCPAPAYGSSFSRAMEISTNGGRRLFISGTASIEPGGKTAWVGDMRKQVGLTMEVVEAMLRSRGFGLTDLSRATAYFRHSSDAGVFSEWLAANGLSNLPAVQAQCDVCRDDLLFELEAEAAVEK